MYSAPNSQSDTGYSESPILVTDFVFKCVYLIVNLTGYIEIDTLLIVTVLEIPKGAIVSGEHCTLFLTTVTSHIAGQIAWFLLSPIETPTCHVFRGGIQFFLSTL